ncbi:E3 ubiquitin-protein ligase RNF26 [Aplochiton taeniatus]
MGLVNFVFCTVGKCIDVINFLLDLNFVIFHTLMQSVVAAITFINNLPMLFASTLVDCWNLLSFCCTLLMEGMSLTAEGAIGVLGSCVLAMGGLLETLKMVGYLTMHILLRGKEQMYRGLLWMWEGCGIVLSLLVYIINTLVNLALLGTQNLYHALVSVFQVLSFPLQLVVDLAPAVVTFLYSSLLGTSSFLLAPCKLALDFLAALSHVFLSVFVLNVYGLLLTATIAAATAVYMNPVLARRCVLRARRYVDSVPALRRLAAALRRLSTLDLDRRRIPMAARCLRRALRCVFLLQANLWRGLSRRGSRMGLALRLPAGGDNHDDGDHDDGDHEDGEYGRVVGDGGPARPDRGGAAGQRAPPDGRAGDGGPFPPEQPGPFHQLRPQDLPDRVPPSSSTDRPLKKLPSSSSLTKEEEKGGGGDDVPPADSLMSLLKEQEERKKCVICQDSTKTVVLLPCRHLCLCRDCTHILLRQPVYLQNCPLCRHMILNTMDVYL